MNSSFLCVIVIGLFLHVFAKKREAYEMADYVAINTFVNGDLPPLLRLERTLAYLICAEKTGVSPDTILSMNRGDWPDGDRKAKAWVQCVLVENKLMTDQSVLQLDVAFKILADIENHQSLEANIDKCLPIKVILPVEIAWQFAKCYQTVDPDNSLF